jgi:hypothetical protein
MHVNANGTPPVHAAAHRRIAEPAPAEATTSQSDAQAASAPAAMTTSSPTLSAGTLGAAIEAQSPGRSGETPAARARALLAENPELADRPFGQVVSRLARGLEVPLPSDEPDEPAPPVVGDEPAVVVPLEGEGDDGGVPPVVETPVVEVVPAPPAEEEPATTISAEDQAALGILASIAEELDPIVGQEPTTEV